MDYMQLAADLSVDELSELWRVSPTTARAKKKGGKPIMMTEFAALLAHHAPPDTLCEACGSSLNQRIEVDTQHLH